MPVRLARDGRRLEEVMDGAISAFEGLKADAARLRVRVDALSARKDSSAAWTAGYVAQGRDKLFSSNPFPVGSLENSEWSDGFKQAEKETVSEFNPIESRGKLSGKEIKAYKKSWKKVRL